MMIKLKGKQIHRFIVLQSYGDLSLEDYRSLQAGETMEVDPAIARLLIDCGMAETVVSNEIDESKGEPQ